MLEGRAVLPACCWDPNVGFRGESSAELLSLPSAAFGERRLCRGGCSVWVQALWLLQRYPPSVVGAAGCLGTWSVLLSQSTHVCSLLKEL